MRLGPPFGFPTRTAVVTDLSYAFCSRKTPSSFVSWSRASLSRSCDRRPPPASASPPEPEDTAERIRAAERSMHRSHAAERSAPSNVGSEAGQVHGLPNASHEPTPNVSSAHVRAKAPRRTRCRRRLLAGGSPCHSKPAGAKHGNTLPTPGEARGSVPGLSSCMHAAARARQDRRKRAKGERPEPTIASKLRIDGGIALRDPPSAARSAAGFPGRLSAGDFSGEEELAPTPTRRGACPGHPSP